MKVIHSGPVMDVVTTGSNLLFAALQTSEDGEKAFVEYKSCDIGRHRLEKVTRNLYLLTKFGDCYEQYADRPEQYLNSRTAFFPNGDLLLVEGDGTGRRLTPQNVCVLQRDFVYHEDTPAAVTVAQNAVWATFGKAGALVRYDLRTLRETTRYGGGTQGDLTGAEGVWFDDDVVTVCCGANCRLRQINLTNHHVSDYHVFDEPVHAFVKMQATEIVWLDSGIYQL